MLALTLWQPWAWAILHLPPDVAKPVENRDWMPPRTLIGKRIAIHGGKAWDRDGAASIIRRGFRIAGPTHAAQGILGTVRLVGVVTARNDGLALVSGTWGETSAARAAPWFVGRYGWLLDQRQVLATPIPCRGLQKLWTVPEDVAARLV